LCGEKLCETVFFVGGCGSALHPNGGYVDPPMHKECATYALEVCPFLALRNYEGAKATYVLEDENENVVMDTGVMKGKPRVFMLKETHGFVNMSDFIKPRLVPTDCVSLESWRFGQRLSEDDPIIDEAIKLELGAIDEMDAKAHKPQLRGRRWVPA
jgi:hypothetical protein